MIRPSSAPGDPSACLSSVFPAQDLGRGCRDFADPMQGAPLSAPGPAALSGTLLASSARPGRRLQCGGTRKAQQSLADRLRRVRGPRRPRWPQTSFSLPPTTDETTAAAACGVNPPHTGPRRAAVPPLRQPGPTNPLRPPLSRAVVCAVPRAWSTVAPGYGSRRSGLGHGARRRCDGVPSS